MPSKLEQIAITQRGLLIAKDTYYQDWSTPADTSKQYTVTHTRALADDITPIYGKGTGKFLDTADYNAGGYYDKVGNSRYAGSGRIQAIVKNISDWGYGPGYGESYLDKKPDTSKNVGKFKII